MGMTGNGVWRLLRLVIFCSVIYRLFLVLPQWSVRIHTEEGIFPTLSCLYFHDAMTAACVMTFSYSAHTQLAKEHFSSMAFLLLGPT